jgi:CheY-like chemotaxis protein
LKSEQIGMAKLVNGMMELLQRSLGPMIMIETDIPEGLPPAQADPNQLESALLNLAVNARDAMPGGGRIMVSARLETIHDNDLRLKPGAYVCLSISDTGEGMDEATAQRATDPFFTTKGVGKGTGLGLSMVQGFAEQSGGTFVLKSAVGEGTIAEIWLPASSEVPAQNEILPEATGDELHLRPLQDMASAKILAVDDDALVLMNTVAMLEDLGYTVISAHSAQQALELAASDRFDLVITDHAMPRMTGTQLAEVLRQSMPDLPIVLATGYAELPPDAAGDLPRLSKPFSQSDLARAVAAAMSLPEHA